MTTVFDRGAGQAIQGWQTLAIIGTHLSKNFRILIRNHAPRWVCWREIVLLGQTYIANPVPVAVSLSFDFEWWQLQCRGSDADVLEYNR